MCVRDWLLYVPLCCVVVAAGAWRPGPPFSSATPLLLRFCARAPVCSLSVYAWLQLGRASSFSFVGIPSVSMYLVSGGPRVGFPSMMVGSGFLGPRLFLTRLIGPAVQVL